MLFTILIVHWVLSILFALIVVAATIYHRDYKGFETGILVLVCFVLTGYISFLPLLIAVFLVERFSKPKSL